MTVLAILELASDLSGGVQIEIRPGASIEIGRATLVALGLPQDPHLSARHFLVVCDSVQCRIQDLGSTNGTIVNGSRISETILHDGDRIEAGKLFCEQSG